MHNRSSSSNNYRSSYSSSGTGFRSQRSDRENHHGANHSQMNRQKQMNGLDDIKNLPKPNWSEHRLRHFEKKFVHELPSAHSRPFAEVTNFLSSNSISVTGGHQVKPVLSFSDLDIPRDVLYKIQDLKFDRPTPIQSMCWPSLLSGQDMVGIAQTGSGKTFGFILPMLIHIMNNQSYVRSFGRDELPGPVGLVVAPTRELAMQIQQVADDFGQQLGVRNVVIYGGSPKHSQLSQARRGADIYIATPGRLIDFVKDKQITLSKCTFLVLDEADRMLDMGFEPQIRKIIEQIRPDRQTAMFSATWPKEVRRLAEDFIKNYVHINIGSGELAANPNILQIIEVCQEYEKEAKVRDILGQIMNQHDSKAIVFSETKKKVEMYSKFIQSLGYHCLAIHGDKKQQEREWVLSEFKRKPKSILCATDVAARGLNISDIKFVINIDYPTQTEDYVHRIGRTARNSNTGTAFTLVTSDNAKHVPKLIEILREANQLVSDSLLALTKGNSYGYRNGPNRYQKPNYNSHDNYNGASKGAYKRTSSNFDESYSREDANGYGGAKKIKKNRWDDSVTENDQSENGYHNQQGGVHFNSSQNAYQNKYQNGNSFNPNRYQMSSSLMPSSDRMGHSEGQYLKNVQAVTPLIPPTLPTPPQLAQNGAQLPPPLMPNPAMYQAYANYL
ncbi:putative ATP-dependent RNA helicase DDX5 isoform X2 [Brachionus plicatilis]|uniref:RNA helicase n=1 Tax=Brachionus plicatilis TaxID=10195 RepID=A0A3M7RAZ3_BRAPC|nr:putative ATP-dependent RNA helicase DDX5 isoform X2 [Brachionus plicatilis]